MAADLERDIDTERPNKKRRTANGSSTTFGATFGVDPQTHSPNPSAGKNQEHICGAVLQISIFNS